MNTSCAENSWHFQYPLYFTEVRRTDAAQVLILITLFCLCIIPETQVALRAKSALVAKMVNLHSRHWYRDRLISQDTSTTIMTQALFCSRSHQSLTQTSWEAWGPGSSHLQGSKWIQLLRVQSVPCFFLLDLLTFFPFLFLRPALVLFFLSQLLHYFLYFSRDIFP